MIDAEPHHADPSLTGKLRRRLVRLQHLRPCARGPGRPMISFSFDDTPVSAMTAGAQVLEDHGVRGTYFFCAGTVGRMGYVGPLGRAEDVVRVSEAGHEIGCHTYSHRDCGRVSEVEARYEAERNAQALQQWGVAAPKTFSYPYGDVGPKAKAAAGTRFLLARALHHGVIVTGSDLAQTPAVGVEGEDGEALAMRWMDAALKRCAWLILFTHGVEAEVTRYGCSRQAFQRLVTRAVSEFQVVTVAEGANILTAAP